MTLEMTMRQRVVRALRPLHACSVENTCGVGMPDVNCSWGWIELKALPSAPAREHTPVRLPHFTNVQKIWLAKRDQAGGRCGVLLMVGREWFYFDAMTAIQILGQVPISCLRVEAASYWPKTPTTEELLQCFQAPN